MFQTERTRPHVDDVITFAHVDTYTVIMYLFVQININVANANCYIHKFSTLMNLQVTIKRDVNHVGTDGVNMIIANAFGKTHRSTFPATCLLN